MRKETRITLIGLLSLLLLIGSSCSSVQLVTHDNGKHQGWYKNPNNPHHPDSTKTKVKADKNSKHQH